MENLPPSPVGSHEGVEIGGCVALNGFDRDRSGAAGGRFFVGGGQIKSPPILAERDLLPGGGIATSGRQTLLDHADVIGTAQ